jgi:hypothetical protein
MLRKMLIEALPQARAGVPVGSEGWSDVLSKKVSRLLNWRLRYTYTVNRDPPDSNLQRRFARLPR